MRAEHSSSGEVQDSLDDAAPTVRGDDPAAEHGAVPDPSARFARAVGGGRYLAIQELGRGAVGRVVRAYDVELHREVAIKEIHTDGFRSQDAVRLVAEARALAAVSHPNVVAVFDVLTPAADDVVLVMELVSGGDLRSWLDAAPRPLGEVLTVFIAAGRGLAAAHASALLHRDFKPANVLLGGALGRGRVVKVADFGLAKPATGAPSTRGAPSFETSGRERVGGEAEDTLDVARDDLTGHGVVVGTPRYMSPEQHQGVDLTEATDQYAFCVALWHALAGTPPFSGGTLIELYASKTAGPPAWPKDAPEVPSRITDALRRGLAVDPQARWPTMAALLDTLAEPAVPRRLATVALAVGVGVAIVAVVARSWTPDARCTGARSQLRGLWDDARRSQTRAAFEATDAPYAPAAWSRVSADLDRYADDWVAAHEEACAATTLRGDATIHAMERKMACLRRTRIELSATTDVLVGADAGVARRAGGLVGDLPDPTRCLDLRTLDAGTDAPAPVEAAGVEGIRVILARARAQRRAGRYEAALRLVEEARVHLPEVTFAGIDAEVAAEEGVTLQALDRHEEARVAHRAALFESLGRRDRKTVQLAASELMVLEGFLSTEAGAGTAYRRLARGVSNGDPLRDAVSAHSEAVMLRLQDRHDESLAAGARALALLERSDRAGDAALTVRFRAQRGQTLRRLSRPGEAQDEFRRAIADARAEFGDDHPDVGRLQIELAMLLQQRHRYPEAEELFVAGLSRLDARYAENTPLVAAAHSAFAGLLRADGRAAQAEATHRAAIASLLEVVGEDHPFVAQSRVGLALALRDQGRTREAETQLREGIDGLTTVLGADHPRVTSATNNLGNLLRADGRAAEAVAVHRQALALRRARSGPTSLPVSQSRYNLGFALRDAGDHQGARDEHAAALAIRLDDPSPDEAAIVDVRLALAEDELRLGHADAAWEQAAAVWRAHETDDEDLRWALMAWVYARALWETQPEARPEARALVQRAAATYRAAGQPTPDIDAWLQRH